MTNFVLILSTGKLNVTGTKYNAAPRSAPFKATYNGKPTDAWTTGGRGSNYIYFKADGELHYAKVLEMDASAARDGLAVESEDYAAKFQPAPAKARTRRVKASA
ncbi:MAG: hypothetical protein EOO27_34585 [Comamonadaceae bacterium]|nr:MAG: hypothetical protein EOO27_34585 [Comamonadaceae bacterium]